MADCLRLSGRPGGCIWQIQEAPGYDGAWLGYPGGKNLKVRVRVGE